MDITKLRTNPDNPRIIKEKDFEELKQKILRIPQGLEANKILHKDGIILAGNQRFRALLELKRDGFEIKDEYFIDGKDWTDEQIREYIVTSNISDGDWDWDILSSTYDLPELEDWGLTLPNYDKEDAEDKQKKLTTCPECGHEF